MSDQIATEQRIKKIVKLWTGQIYGTNIGNIFLELTTQHENQIAGDLYINETGAPAALRYFVSGTYSDKVVLEGTIDPSLKNLAPEFNIGSLRAEGKLTPEGVLQGTWHTSLNTAGTFTLYPCTITEKMNVPEVISPSPHYRIIELGAIKLYLTDLEKITNEIKKEYKNSQIMISLQQEETSTSIDSEEFFNNEQRTHQLKVVCVFAQDKQQQRSIRILLSPSKNTIAVTGLDAKKVNEEVEKFETLFNKHKKQWATLYKKYGPLTYGILFVTMIVLLPGFSTLMKRALFAFPILALISLLSHLNKEHNPNFLLITKKKDRKPYKQKLLDIFPTLQTILTIATPFIIWLLNYYLKK